MVQQAGLAGLAGCGLWVQPMKIRFQPPVICAA